MKKIKYNGICERCGEGFINGKKFNGHIGNGKDCSVYYKIKYLDPKICPNCNTLWATYKYLDKHMEYHGHLNGEERKQIPVNNDDQQTIARGNYYQHGLPKAYKYTDGGGIFYNTENKTWNCTICYISRNMYKWKHMAMRVNAKTQ